MKGLSPWKLNYCLITVSLVANVSPNKSLMIGYSHLTSQKISLQQLIHESASQMITLLHFLPLIIGDKIPSDNEYWHNFLLIKICGLAMSPVFTHDNAAYLSLLVGKKFKLFTKLFPTTRLIPKQHYMIHCAQQIVNFGPLVQAWCMRQEAKLSFIKCVSRK